MPSPTPVVRAVSHHDIIDLRHVVLRAGLPRDEAIFAGDEKPTSRHYAAYLVDAVVGCVTLHPSTFEGEPAWQLRGMAVSPAWQRYGVGAKLLAEAESGAKREGPALLWCNAREHAVGFYARHGWQVIGERFEIPTAGPHFRMSKRV